MDVRGQSQDDELMLGHCPFCYPNPKAITCSSHLFLAIYNISPIVRGHTLIVPREHVPSIFHLGRSGVQEFTSFAALVTKAVLRAYEYQDFNWLLQEGPASGQSVEHLHMHIIPRIEGDLESPDSWFEEVTGTRIRNSRDRPAVAGERLKEEVVLLQKMFRMLETVSDINTGVSDNE